MNNDFPYPIIVYPAEEGRYVAEVPALKGCLAQGETLEEYLQELKTVQAFWLESAKRNNQRVPSSDEGMAQLRQLVT